MSPDFWWVLYVGCYPNNTYHIFLYWQILHVLLVMLLWHNNIILESPWTYACFCLRWYINTKDSYDHYIDSLVYSSPEHKVLRASYCNWPLSVVCQLFSSPEHKVLKVSFCDGPLSIIHVCVRASVRASTISVNNFSSETTHWILTKLHRNDPWVIVYQNCSNRSSWLHK